jgi:hypothetical protein
MTRNASRPIPTRSRPLPGWSTGRTLTLLSLLLLTASCARPTRGYNGAYTGTYLNRVAFPLGGIGAGMVCLEGTGALSHVSVRNSPQIFNAPHTWAALGV